MNVETRTIDTAAHVDGRCPASIMPGQRCGRPVGEGETLCENHVAMGSPMSGDDTGRQPRPPAVA